MSHGPRRPHPSFLLSHTPGPGSWSIRRGCQAVPQAHDISLPHRRTVCCRGKGAAYIRSRPALPSSLPPALSGRPARPGKVSSGSGRGPAGHENGLEDLDGPQKRPHPVGTARRPPPCPLAREAGTMSVSRMALLLLLLLTQMACGAGLPTDQNRWNWKSGPGTQAPARSRRDIMTVMTPEEDTDYHFTFQTEGPEVLVNNTHASAPPTPAGTESVEPPTTGGPDPGETAETSSPVIATLNTSAGQPGPSVVPGEPHSELPTATSMPASSSVTFDPSSLPIAPTDPSSEPTGHPDDSTLSDRPTARDPSSSDPPDTTGPSSEPTGPPDNLAHSDSTTAGDPSTAPPNTTSPSSEPTGPLDNLTPSDSTAASDPSSAPTSANGPSSAPTPTLIPTKDPSPEHPTSIEPGKAPAPTAATRAPTSPVQKKTVQPGLYFRQTRATGPPGPEETSPPPAQAPSGGSIPVRQCLLAILILALIATTFLVCTVVLAVRLSRQLHTYPLRSSYSTEMVCISSLLPDGEGAAGANGAIGGPARNRAPAPTLGRGRAEDCEGDDLTLHSFLPEQ